MVFQWDSAKRIRNLDKHGIDFNRARDIFAQFHVILKTYENRELAIGLINGRVVTVVYEWRGDDIRIISARRARKNEEQIYNKIQ